VLLQLTTSPEGCIDDNGVTGGGSVGSGGGGSGGSGSGSGGLRACPPSAMATDGSTIHVTFTGVNFGFEDTVTSPAACAAATVPVHV
jgi:hypothetical protein